MEGCRELLALGFRKRQHCQHLEAQIEERHDSVRFHPAAPDCSEAGEWLSAATQSRSQQISGTNELTSILAKCWLMLANQPAVRPPTASFCKLEEDVTHLNTMIGKYSRGRLGDMTGSQA